MFHTVDAVLQALLEATGGPAADVSFATPDREFAPTATTLNLFLFDVRENRELRNTSPVMRPVGPAGAPTGYRASAPPMRVDCSYMVSAWSTLTGAQRIDQEHRLLGEALQWLSRFPVLKVDDPLIEQIITQPLPIPVVVGHGAEDRTSGQFWSALGIAPRTTFTLSVTVAMTTAPDTDVVAVREDGLDVRHTSLTAPVLAGRVRTKADLRPVTAATVTVVEADLHATSGPGGGFEFADLPAGDYTLQVVAAGHDDTSKPIRFHRRSQFHDVLLDD